MRVIESTAAANWKPWYACVFDSTDEFSQTDDITYYFNFVTGESIWIIRVMTLQKALRTGKAKICWCIKSADDQAKSVYSKAGSKSKNNDEKAIAPSLLLLKVGMIGVAFQHYIKAANDESHSEDDDEEDDEDDDEEEEGDDEEEVEEDDELQEDVEDNDETKLRRKEEESHIRTDEDSSGKKSLSISDDDFTPPGHQYLKAESNGKLDRTTSKSTQERVQVESSASKQEIMKSSVERLDGYRLDQEKKALEELYKKKIAELEEKEKEALHLKEAAVRAATESQIEEEEKFKEKLSVLKERYSQMIMKEEELQKTRFQERLEGVRESYDEKFEDEKKKLEDQLEALRNENGESLKKFTQSLKAIQDEEKAKVEKQLSDSLKIFTDELNKRIEEERRALTTRIDRERADFETYATSILEEAKKKINSDHERELEDLRDRLSRKTAMIMNEMKKLDSIEQEVESRRRELEDAKSDLILHEREVENRRKAIAEEKVTLAELEKELAISVEQQKRARLTAPAHHVPMQAVPMQQVPTVETYERRQTYIPTSPRKTEIEGHDAYFIQDDPESDFESENTSSSPTMRLKRQFKKEERQIEQARQFIKQQKERVLDPFDSPRSINPQINFVASNMRNPDYVPSEFGQPEMQCLTQVL
ncbi:hypothetical protein BC829DRAFT_378954 [Chytridium lagenaria]|nr:hypothetical protein BC829DRAFT_378954 [Chytridium lagenaria]